MIRRIFTALLMKRAKKAMSAFTDAREELIAINTELASHIKANTIRVEKLHKKNEAFQALTSKHNKVISNITKFLED